MSVFLGLFFAQLLDPVRIVLAVLATYVICSNLPKGRRFTALSIATVAVCAAMTLLLTLIPIVTPSQEKIATSFVIGLFSTGVIVAVSAVVITKLGRS